MSQSYLHWSYSVIFIMCGRRCFIMSTCRNPIFIGATLSLERMELKIKILLSQSYLHWSYSVICDIRGLSFFRCVAILSSLELLCHLLWQFFCCTQYCRNPIFIGATLSFEESSMYLIIITLTNFQL